MWRCGSSCPTSRQPRGDPAGDGSPHPCGTYGVARPAEMLASMALGRRSLIRMRSQVQVLAGPPHQSRRSQPRPTDHWACLSGWVARFVPPACQSGLQLESSACVDATWHQLVSKAVQLTEAAYTDIETWRATFRAGRRHIQDDTRRYETTARTIRNFHPAIVPGLLQTAEYTRRVLTLAETDPVRKERHDRPAAIAGRVQRQEALYDKTRQFDFLITEARCVGNLTTAL
jgi:Domain of unknown function (DUF5753)